jgi:hypothetical protein
MGRPGPLSKTSVSKTPAGHRPFKPPYQNGIDLKNEGLAGATGALLSAAGRCDDGFLLEGPRGKKGGFLCAAAADEMF